MPNNKYEAIEYEVILLKAVNELITDMVNHSMFDVLGEKPNCQVMFKTPTHFQFFGVLLVDFLSCTDPHVLGNKSSYLEAFQAICSNPSFSDNHISLLSKTVSEFKHWLEEEIVVENAWFPSIDKKLDLSLNRMQYIKICGNISKHNFTRLSAVAQEMVRIFSKNGVEINIEQALVLFEDFYSRFNDDVFLYHSSVIVESLNNIRWGIQEYLTPEFSRSIVYKQYDEGIGVRPYAYTYPKGIHNQFAKICYWNLMNDVRAEPYVARFVVSRYLKNRY